MSSFELNPKQKGKLRLKAMRDNALTKNDTIKISWLKQKIKDGTKLEKKQAEFALNARKFVHSK